jgi:iron complex transport system substrate-binding protein
MVTGPGRVVSLLPSLTEIVCALGAGERLVGRSHECDHPPGVEALPSVTAPRFESTPSMPSAGVDAEVRRLLRDALSPFSVDEGRLRALAPDLVLTQDQCRACAVSLADVQRALGAACGGAPAVLSVSPHTLGDVWDSVRTVAEALGCVDEGRALLARLGERVGNLGEHAGRRGWRPRVAMLEWLAPLMLAGHWTPELVAIAGGEPVLARAGERSRWISWSELRGADPDVIVVAPCGFPLERTRRELGLLAALPGWRRLAAVRSGRVFLADGNALFNRPGPRLVDSLALLAELLDQAANRAGSNAGSAQPLPSTPSATSWPVSGASSTPLR